MTEPRKQMLTVGELKRELHSLDDDHVVSAYEGEGGAWIQIADRPFVKGQGIPKGIAVISAPDQGEIDARQKIEDRRS
jgi:hypothetical protein